jgi:hypothetical protein
MTVAVVVSVARTTIRSAIAPAGLLSLSVGQKKMSLTFEATAVSCDDAMDGEILRVCFDTVSAAQDEEERRTPYVLIMQNFEFPGPATIEWHDGHDYDGGADIDSVTLGRTRVSIRLRRAIDIDVTFQIAERQFVQLSTYLTRMIDRHIRCQA